MNFILALVSRTIPYTQVARYILSKRQPCTLWELQCLMYYCQAWFLATYGRPMFRLDFEAHAGGPWAPQLAKDFQQYIRLHESSTKPLPPKYLTMMKYVTLPFLTRNFIDELLEAYKDTNAQDFITYSWSRNDRPFRVARRNHTDLEECHEIIDPHNMKYFYRYISKERIPDAN